MARIFITGSADGLGRLTAKELLSRGHEVMLHARNAARGKQAADQLPGAAGVLTGDLSDMEETKALALKVNAAGPFDVVIHNAGVYRESNQLTFAGKHPGSLYLNLFIQAPKRLIYLSSGMHLQGNPHPDNIIKGNKRQ